MRGVESSGRWPFLPTPSARRATYTVTLAQRIQQLFLPTPSARRATQHLEVHCVGLIFISTHALREEGDRVYGKGIFGRV